MWPLASYRIESWSYLYLKVNCTITIDIHLHDQSQEFIFSWILSHAPHHTQQLLGGDCATAILTMNTHINLQQLIANFNEISLFIIKLYRHVHCRIYLLSKVLLQTNMIKVLEATAMNSYFLFTLQKKNWLTLKFWGQSGERK